jgi:ubiquinone/menaquinone biosynthesis C-methylase UbiE
MRQNAGRVKNMKSLSSVNLADVQAVYSGPEGRLWELIMGQQVHIGGMQSSHDLADKAGIQPGTSGIDLCCCSGAGMRFLVRLRGVKRMQGVDATPAVIQLGRQRCKEEGLDDKIELLLADAATTGLPAGAVDFVWGEDAWCYVADKPRLMAEAARLVASGGTIAFTDWIEGEGLTEAEAGRYLGFMKFPSVLSRGDYCDLLRKNGCEVVIAQDTGRFAPCLDLYANMLTMQLGGDALRIIGYDMAMMAALAGEMAFMGQLAQAGKIAQGLFVARKRD